MIQPILQAEQPREWTKTESGDVDILRETLFAIGRIPMLTAEEETRLARQIKFAKGRLRRSMLGAPGVIRGLAELLQRVSQGQERLDRALDFSLSDAQRKRTMLKIAGMHAQTLRGMAEQLEQADEEQPIDRPMLRKLQRLVDESMVRTARIEALFEDYGEIDDEQYRRARERYEDLRNRMVSANLRLAVSVAKKYQNSGVPLLDLIQEGSEGLIRAAEKFDPALGFKFSTYSVWWIRQRVRAAVTEKSRIIRIGEAAANRIRNLTEDVAKENSVDPRNISFEDLPVARQRAGRREEVRRSFYACRDVLSLDRPVSTKSESTAADFLESKQVNFDEGLIRGEQQEMIGEAFDVLTDKESKVLRLRFGLDDGNVRNLAEVGRILDISRERVRQIEKVSLKKLRARMSGSERN